MGLREFDTLSEDMFLFVLIGCKFRFIYKNKEFYNII